MNLHTPERQPNETQAAYHIRRAASRAAFQDSQAMPRNDRLPLFNRTANARREAKRAIGARQFRKNLKAMRRAQ